MTSPWQGTSIAPQSLTPTYDPLSPTTIDVATPGTNTIYVKGFHDPSKSVQKEVTVAVCDTVTVSTSGPASMYERVFTGTAAAPDSFVGKVYVFEMGDTAASIADLNTDILGLFASTPTYASSPACNVIWYQLYSAFTDYASAKTLFLPAGADLIPSSKSAGWAPTQPTPVDTTAVAALEIIAHAY